MLSPHLPDYPPGLPPIHGDVAAQDRALGRSDAGQGPHIRAVQPMLPLQHRSHAPRPLQKLEEPFQVRPEGPRRFQVRPEGPRRPQHITCTISLRLS